MEREDTMKKKWFALLLSVAMILSLAACGGKKNSETNASGAEQATLEATQEGQSQEENAPPDIDVINQALEANIPEEYKNSPFFQAYAEDTWDNTVDVYLQFDQGNGDTNAALNLAAEYFNVAMRVLNDAGATLDAYSMTVMNGSDSVGLYSTEDGLTYVVIANGQRSEVAAP